jgi:hypothetical protein
MAKPPKKPKDDDQAREDEILRRMLNTPPKPHKPPKPNRPTSTKSVR